MARPYATNSDLQVFIPKILTFGTTDFGLQLDKASEDVLNLIKADWWPAAVQTRWNAETIDIGPLTPTIDETKINDAALLNLTCYRAFHHYIFPLLTKDSDADGDNFSRKIDRYRDYFESEWNTVKNLALYDFDGDAQFQDIERRGPTSRRVRRA